MNAKLKENAPFLVPPTRVEPEWIDYNGHMNVGYYVIAFDKALDHVFDYLGIGVDYVSKSSNSVFTLQNHVHYLRELKAGDPYQVSFQLLAADEKRLHYYMEMNHVGQGFLAAAEEQVALHVSMATRKSAPFPASARERIAAMLAAHRDLPRPAYVGKPIGLTTEHH